MREPVVQLMELDLPMVKNTFDQVHDGRPDGLGVLLWEVRIATGKTSLDVAAELTLNSPQKAFDFFINLMFHGIDYSSGYTAIQDYQSHSVVFGD